jgi:hypothetical protein
VRRLAPLGVFAGAAGFAAGLTCAYLAMRDLMVESGGFCASGGPYEIAAGHQCGSEAGLLLGGIVALFVFGALFAAATGAGGGPGSGMDAGFLMWTALFGALGVNFLTLGFDPPPRVAGGGGWIVAGVVFELMALAGLVPLIWSVRELIARRGEPEAPLFRAPLVRANVQPAQPPADAPPPSSAHLPRNLDLPQRDWRSP